jgi:hypothetical protein
MQYFRHNIPITDPQAISHNQQNFTYNNNNNTYFLVNMFRISGPQ